MIYKLNGLMKKDSVFRHCPFMILICENLFFDVFNYSTNLLNSDLSITGRMKRCVVTLPAPQMLSVNVGLPSDV